MINFCNNAKRNGVLNAIYDHIKEVFEDDYVSEVKRYYKAFRNESDYNIAQYGNLLVYFYSIREFLKVHGYTQYMEHYKQKGKQHDFRISDDEVWSFYKQLVREVADYIIEHEA